MLGLVRHLTEIERDYLVNELSGRNSGVVYTDDDEEADIEGRGLSGKYPVRVYVLKVLQEYARHNGHADIIRDRIDGARGE